MKSLIIATTLSLGLMTAAMAQPSAEDRAARSAEHTQRRVDFLAEKLSLTEAQKLEVGAIYAEQAQARAEMHARFRAEGKALREQGDAKLSAVLTTEQKAQMDQLRAERKAHRGGKHGVRRHGRHDSR